MRPGRISVSALKSSDRCIGFSERKKARTRRAEHIIPLALAVAKKAFPALPVSNEVEKGAEKEADSAECDKRRQQAEKAANMRLTVRAGRTGESRGQRAAADNKSHSQSARLIHHCSVLLGV